MIRTGLIRAGLQIHVWGLPLHKPGEAPVAVPRPYFAIGLDELDDGRLGDLVELYRLVFGSEGGEGGRCQQCHRAIPLEDFEVMKFYQRRCDCGGMFLSFYPPDELRLQIRQNLAASDVSQPILALMGGYVSEFGRTLGLSGVAWGTVLTASGLERRMVDGRFGERIYWPQIRELVRRLRFLGFTGRILFVDEFFVHRSARTLEAPVFLARPLFDHALKNETWAVVVWTKPGWPFNRFWASLGFGEMYRVEDYHFLLNEDIRPAQKLLQNSGAQGLAKWQKLISWLL